METVIVSKSFYEAVQKLADAADDAIDYLGNEDHLGLEAVRREVRETLTVVLDEFEEMERLKIAGLL